MRRGKERTRRAKRAGQDGRSSAQDLYTGIYSRTWDMGLQDVGAWQEGRDMELWMLHRLAPREPSRMTDAGAEFDQVMAGCPASSAGGAPRADTGIQGSS